MIDTKVLSKINAAYSLIALLKHKDKGSLSKKISHREEQSETLLSSAMKELSLHFITTEVQDAHEQQEVNKLLEQVINSIAETTKNPSQKDIAKNITVDELNKVYEHLLPLTQLLHLKEKNGIPEEQAWKLAVTFGSFNDAFNYLLSSQKSLHDSCLYALPAEVAERTSCNLAAWKGLKKWQALTRDHMTKQDFKTMLANAIAIETMIASEAKKAFESSKKDQPSAKFGEARNGQNEEIENIQKRIQEHNAKYDKIKNKRVNPNKYGKPTEDDEQFYDTYSQELHKFYLSLADAYNGKGFLHANIEIIKAYYEKYKNDTDKEYSFFLKHGLTKRDYEKFLKLKRIDSERIPAIQIDGATINKDGYYLRRLNVENSEDAVMAACLGKLSNCCQSLSGEAGEPCAIHGLTSPEGGFYVICKGDIRHPSIEDPLIAQSWVWRSKNGALVIDSVESNYTIHKGNDKENKIAQTFYFELARQLVTGSYDIQNVTSGRKSGISSILNFFYLIEPEQPIDYDGYRDSNSQQLLATQNLDIFLNMPDRQGKTPLIRAIEKNNSNMVECLLNSGADPNRQSNFPDSALTLAVKTIKNNNIETLVLLLSKGATIKQKEELDALIGICIQSHSKTLYEIVIKGLDESLKSYFTKNIDNYLSIATNCYSRSFREKEPIVMALLESKLVNRTYIDNNSILVKIHKNFSLDFLSNVIETFREKFSPSHWYHLFESFRSEITSNDIKQILPEKLKIMYEIVNSNDTKKLTEIVESVNYSEPFFFEALKFNPRIYDIYSEKQKLPSSAHIFSIAIMHDVSQRSAAIDLLQNTVDERQALELISSDPTMFKFLHDSFKHDKRFIITFIRSHYQYNEKFEEFSIEELYIELLTQITNTFDPPYGWQGDNDHIQEAKKYAIDYLTNPDFIKKLLKRSPENFVILPDHLKSNLTFVDHVLKTQEYINLRPFVSTKKLSAFVSTYDEKTRQAMIDMEQNPSDQQLFIKNLIRYGNTVVHFASSAIKNEKEISEIISNSCNSHDHLMFFSYSNDDHDLSQSEKTDHNIYLYLLKHKDDVITLINENRELFTYLPTTLQQDPDILSVAISNDLSKVIYIPEEIRKDEPSLLTLLLSNNELSNLSMNEIYIYLFKEKLIPLDWIPETITQDKYNACQLISAKYPELKNILIPEKYNNAIEVYLAALGNHNKILPTDIPSCFHAEKTISKFLSSFENSAENSDDDGFDDDSFDDTMEDHTEKSPLKNH